MPPSTARLSDARRRKYQAAIKVTHGWKVIFRDDVMGFTKGYEVEATNIGHALDEAYKLMEADGYRRGRLRPISVERFATKAER